MSRGLPSMTALLGLLAVAGYQNRDKISEMLGGLSRPGGQPGAQPGMQSGNPGGGLGDMLGGGLGGLLGGLGGASAGSVLSGGLGDIVDRFRQSGRGDVADSWVSTGPNKPVEPTDLEHALGPEVIEHLTRQTGLGRDEILSRLSRNLPDAVDRYTPDGRLPSDEYFGRG